MESESGVELRERKTGCKGLKMQTERERERLKGSGYMKRKAFRTIFEIRSHREKGTNKM